MTLAEFHNALRVLTSIDRHEVDDVFTDGAAWQAFRTDPFRWFIRADDETAKKLWRIIELRQLRTPPIDELRAAKPLVLYFHNDTDREEMIAAVRAEKPGMVEAVVP